MNTVTYAPTAYRPDRIPAQLPSSERSWLKKMGRVRLPWGNTQELAPARFFYKDSPERLRIREQVEREDAEKKPMVPINPELRKRKTFTIYMTINGTALLNFLLGGASGRLCMLLEGEDSGFFSRCKLLPA